MLKAAIRAQLEKMIQLNRTRADFAEKFEALIESYNAGSRTIEALYAELLELSNSLNKEPLGSWLLLRHAFYVVQATGEDGV